MDKTYPCKTYAPCHSGYYIKPTVLFGKDPGKFYPNMAIKIGKFGETDADLKFHEVVEGNLIQLKDRIGEILNAKFFVHPIDFMGMQRVELDEYPVAAVREMILNALAHRNYMGAPTQIRLYDDNFSVWNDGGLPEGISEEDLKKVHRFKPRNPLLADICFKAGYIDSWGRGTIKIIEACKKAGLPEPALKEEQGGFLSKIFKDRLTKEQLKKVGLNERQINAVEYVKKNGKITNKDYQKINDCSRNTASGDLGNLVEKKIFKPSDVKGAGSFYVLK